MSEIIEEVKVGERFLYKRHMWEDVSEATLLEISPGKEYVKIEFAGGFVEWREADELTVVEVLGGKR